ncbi:unnamed protein product [Lymnaea stagnalis]|uniref:Uncharacterized protein n=1 Tax=Lymnaea stagnalis TaxID=6523 RepID=A0AAV2I6H5_LYMST
MAIKMSRLFMHFLIPTIFTLTHGQNIRLKYNQEESVTNCTHGLIVGDTVVFKASIDYSADPTMKHVHFYINKKDEIVPIVKTYNLKEDCYTGNDDCKHTDASHVVITYKVEARKEYNGASIHGKLFTSESLEIDSEFLHFPKIIDPSDVNSRLKFNEKEISASEDYHLLSVNETDVNIVYTCESKVSPCLIEISTNDSVPFVHGIGYAIYQKRYSQIRDLTVITKFGACRLDRSVKTIKCNLKSDRKTSTEKGFSTDPTNIVNKLYGIPQYFLMISLVIFVLFIITVLTNGLLLIQMSRQLKKSSNFLQSYASNPPPTEV